MNELGIKELYDVILKTTYKIEVGGREIESGETVAAFDKIQLANLQEQKNRTLARGGFDNRALIWWEDTQEVRFSLTQGVFSKTQLALMSNASLIQNNGSSVISVNCREVVETDSRGCARTKHSIKSPCFIYKHPSGERIRDLVISDDAINTGVPYQEYLIDYYYDYKNEYEVLSVGDPLISGYLLLEGKVRVKDDTTGQITTGIIRIPKLKLMSDLSMRLGQDAVPMVGRLDAIAVPTGERGHKKVMELIFLNDDIDSDM